MGPKQASLNAGRVSEARYNHDTYTTPRESVMVTGNGSSGHPPKLYSRFRRWFPSYVILLCVSVLAGRFSVAHSATAGETPRLPGGISAFKTPASQAPHVKLSPKPLSPRISFVENRGQFNSAVKYRASNGSRSFWVTATGITFQIPAQRPLTSQSAGEHDHTDHEHQTFSFKSRFVGMQASARIGPMAQLDGFYNFF